MQPFSASEPIRIEQARRDLRLFSHSSRARNFTASKRGASIHASHDSPPSSTVYHAYAHRHGSTRIHPALDSPVGWDHLGGIALLFQPGKCPFHEAGRCRSEAENFPVPDHARPAIISLERNAYGICGLLVLVPD